MFGNGALFSMVTTATPLAATSTQQSDTPANTSTGGVDLPVPSAPIAVTNTTANPGEVFAIVTGTVNPDGALTSYWYEFGISATLGNKTASQTVGSGFVATPAPAYITGLAKDTTYFFRLVAKNQLGTVAGNQYTFQTTHGVTTPVGSIPTIRTTLVSGITNNSGDVSGEVTPNQASTQYWFEYGKTGTLGNTTALVSVGDGGASVPASALVSNLSSGTLYYYRINAQNQFGTVNGSILTFKTVGTAPMPVPVVTTQVTSPVGMTTATVRGTVNPYGVKTTYWFEYSTDAVFAAGSVKTTTQHTTGALTSTISLQADISRLTTKTVYYVRIVAQNAAGVVRGDTQSFTTT
jgi:hypothetical protein